MDSLTRTESECFYCLADAEQGASTVQRATNPGVLCLLVRARRHGHELLDEGDEEPAQEEGEPEARQSAAGEAQPRPETPAEGSEGKVCA